MRCKKCNIVYRHANIKTKETQICGKCRRGFSTNAGSRIEKGCTVS